MQTNRFSRKWTETGSLRRSVSRTWSLCSHLPKRTQRWMGRIGAHQGSVQTDYRTYVKETAENSEPFIRFGFINISSNVFNTSGRSNLPKNFPLKRRREDCPSLRGSFSSLSHGNRISLISRAPILFDVVPASRAGDVEFLPRTFWCLWCAVGRFYVRLACISKCPSFNKSPSCPSLFGLMSSLFMFSFPSD